MTDLLIAELLIATGAGLIIVGTAVIYWPASMIVAGLFLLALVAVALIMEEPDRPLHHPRTEWEDT